MRRTNGRAKVIAEAIYELDKRYPHLSELATRTHVSETELRLKKAIETVRADLTVKIEEVHRDLTVKVEAIRSETAQIRAEMGVKAQELKTEMVQIRADIANTSRSTVIWLSGLMTFLACGVIGAVTALSL